MQTNMQQNMHKIWLKICKQYANTQKKYAKYVRSINISSLSQNMQICKKYAEYVSQNPICRICTPHFVDGHTVCGCCPASDCSTRIWSPSHSAGQARLNWSLWSPYSFTTTLHFQLGPIMISLAMQASLSSTQEPLLLSSLLPIICLFN
jgi:hypothetical protein